MSTLETWHEIQQFLFREARLLDDRRFRDWLKIFTDDIVYWAPMLSNRVGRDMRLERTKFGEMAHFEEDIQSLTGRVARLETGMAWAESPPSRTRHLISNVEVQATGEPGVYKVFSAFMLYRTHLETDEEIYGGAREDLIKRTDDGWRVAKRTIQIDQAVTLGKNLAVFF